MNFPLTKSIFGGKIGQEFDRLTEAINSLRPISSPGETVQHTTRGVVRSVTQNNKAAGTHLKQLWIRSIGIDAMWVSDPAPGYGFFNYHNAADADTEKHYFCLKPFELMNRSFYDEANGFDAQGITNSNYGIEGGASPQAGFLTVQSVSGETYHFGTGPFTGIKQRTLHYGGGTPEPVFVQTVDPPIVTVGFGLGDTSYGGTTSLWAAKIPAGLFVCDERGKIVWDATYPSEKPATLGPVLTWGIDDPSSPSGLVSLPKPGNYDVEYVDLNVDGRHWRNGDLSVEQQGAAQVALNFSHLDTNETYSLKLVSGTLQWVED